MELRKKVSKYIIACMDDDNTDQMDKCLMDFTEQELHIMYGGKLPDIKNYENTANPKWCLNFDCVNKWIYKMLDIHIKMGIRSEETELYFWYWMNV